MKKTIRILSACRLFALSLLFLLAIPSYSLGEEAATEKIFSLVQQQLGYTQDQLSVYEIMETTEGGLAFSLKIKDADPSTNGLVIGLLDGAGNLIELEGPKSIDLFTQFLNDWYASRFSYENVYTLVQKWRPIVNGMPPKELAEFDRSKHVRDIYAFVNHPIGLPTAEDLSHDEALAYAKAEILKLPGWTQEKLDLLRIRTEAYHIPTGTERPAYYFIFCCASEVERLKAIQSDGPYTFDSHAWKTKEKAVFGDATLYTVSVHIDAQTGALIGNIWVEFLPTSTSYDDIMLIILDPSIESIGS